ncbi:MAG: undecaprenyl-phosphate glucose phosphotransferase [Ignavibacteriaceae bacterium]|nr:undecaprenyl-phosphate glucose phosphotransferase [Ignavibacteriaceae bacterium]
MQIQRSSLYYLRYIADFFVIAAAFWLSVFIVQPVYYSLHFYELEFFFFSLVLIWFFTAHTLQLYDEFRSRNFSYELISLFRAILVQSLAVIVLDFILKELQFLRAYVLVYTGFLVLLLTLERYSFRLLLGYFRKRGKNLRNILIVGAGEVGMNFFETILTNPHFGYRLVGFLDDKEIPKLNGEYLGPISNLENVLEKKAVDNVIIALPNYATERLEEVIQTCERYTTRIKIIPDYFKFVSDKYTVSMFDRFPVISVRDDRINDFQWRLLKRTFDIMFTSILFLLVFSWLWPLIGAVIKIGSPGPVLFKQSRWGRNNKKFITYKFRSMVITSKDIDENGKFQQATKDDPRITGIGRILRKTNLDELPQFWNVLKGEMSIVGPRPHPGTLNIESRKKIKLYMQRHIVKPGITGWAQVNGFRGETGTRDLMQKRVDHDLWYIENWSFWLDINIIFLTVWLMVKGDPNAY